MALPSLAYLGQFAFDHADKAIPLLVGLWKTWLMNRRGRKVRLKVGDIEVEAHTPEEIEKLLVLAQETQQRNQQPKVIP
jgi:hypothetical protein